MEQDFRKFLDHCFKVSVIPDSMLVMDQADASIIAVGDQESMTLLENVLAHHFGERCRETAVYRSMRVGLVFDVANEIVSVSYTVCRLTEKFGEDELNLTLRMETVSSGDSVLVTIVSNGEVSKAVDVRLPSGVGIDSDDQTTNQEYFWATKVLRVWAVTPIAIV